mmetsp:Transcript_230/g.357  ORF Transcript_230/g.357 Transcript_230/m.357 type:complete len:108 (+) Transcript_230:137-460(+)
MSYYCTDFLNEFNLTCISEIWDLSSEFLSIISAFSSVICDFIGTISVLISFYPQEAQFVFQFTSRVEQPRRQLLVNLEQPNYQLFVLPIKVISHGNLSSWMPVAIML